MQIIYKRLILLMLIDEYLFSDQGTFYILTQLVRVVQF